MATGTLRPLCSYHLPVMASKASRKPSSPKINGSPHRQNHKQQQQPQKPSVAEVQRAIGVTSDSFQTPTGTLYSSSPSPSPPPPPPQSPPSPSSSSSSSSSFLDFVSRTPVGQPVGAVERKLREAAEWMVERTEPHELSGQRTILLVCLSILPLWILLLLVASGVIKLPFDLPFWSDLIA